MKIRCFHLECFSWIEFLEAYDRSVSPTIFVIMLPSNYVSHVSFPSDWRYWARIETEKDIRFARELHRGFVRCRSGELCNRTVGGGPKSTVPWRCWSSAVPSVRRRCAGVDRPRGAPVRDKRVRKLGRHTWKPGPAKQLIRTVLANVVQCPTVTRRVLLHGTTWWSLGCVDANVLSYSWAHSALIDPIICQID